MKTTFFSSVLLLGVLFSSAQTTAPAQSIIVNGYSEVKIPADIIHLDVTISNAYIDASSITQLVDQYNSLLRKLGVDAKKSVLKDTQKYEPLPGDDFTAAYETRFYSLELNNPATYTKFISEIYNIQGASYTLGEYTYSKINEIKDKAYREAWTDAQNRANMLLALGGYKTSGVNSMEDMSMNYIPMSGSNNYYYDDTTLSTNTELLVSFSAQLRVVYLFAK